MDLSQSKPFAQIAYEAYAASTGGLTFDKRPMPTWAEIVERTPHVARAWSAAADAVRNAPLPEDVEVGNWRRAHPRGFHATHTAGAHLLVVTDAAGNKVDDVVWIDPDTHFVERAGRPPEQVEGWTFGRPDGPRQAI